MNSGWIERTVRACLGRPRRARLALPAALFVFMFMAAVAQPGAGAEDHGKAPAASPEAQGAEAIYAGRCAACHDVAADRTPPRSALLFVPPRVIVRALSQGSMKPMAAGLSDEEIRALASHLSLLPDRPPQANPPRCASLARTQSRYP